MAPARRSNRLGRRLAAGVGAAVVLTLAATGCSQQMRAERDGRDLADSVCDLRDAGPDARKEAVDDLAAEIDRLSDRYALATAEDRADIRNNLADLYEHVIQGNDVLVEQDLAVLRRSAANITEDFGAVQQSAWDGFVDGLGECSS